MIADCWIHAVRGWLRGLVFGGLGAWMISSGLAAPAVFTVDPARSSVSLEGKVLGFPLQAQSAGSLTAAYEGTLAAEVSGAAITFLEGGVVRARVTGDWQPKPGGEAGSAPGNYGGKASAFVANAVAAARGIQLAAFSGPIPLASGQFDAGAVGFRFIEAPDATLDYLVTGLLSNKGSVPLSGVATNQESAKATLVVSGETETLTIPVRATYLLDLLATDDVELTLRGTLVATRAAGGGGGGTLDGYLRTHFPNVTDPAVVGPQADPEGDGLPNFVEFAFGLDPKSKDNGFAPLKLPVTEARSDARAFQFNRPAGLAGVVYELQSSVDLKTWVRVDRPPTVTPSGNGQELVKITDNSVIPPGGFQWVRLVVRAP